MFANEEWLYISGRMKKAAEATWVRPPLSLRGISNGWERGRKSREWERNMIEWDKDKQIRER